MKPRLSGWRRSRLGYAGLLGASLSLTACDPLAETSYLFHQSIHDPETGRYVELGELRNFSSNCVVVNVFDDQKRDRKATESRSPVMIACSYKSAPSLSVEDGCYILRIEYDYGGVRQDKWIDDASGKSICFGIYPRGPRGGWSP